MPRRRPRQTPHPENPRRKLPRREFSDLSRTAGEVTADDGKRRAQPRAKRAVNTLSPAVSGEGRKGETTVPSRLSGVSGSLYLPRIRTTVLRTRPDAMLR